jgi:hypothetical protein
VSPSTHSITVLVAELDDLDRVGVPDAGREARLVEEHRLEGRVVAELRQHRLDGDDLLEAAGSHEARRPDGRHPSTGDRHEELVAAQRVSRLEVRQDLHAVVLLDGEAEFGGVGLECHRYVRGGP